MKANDVLQILNDFSGAVLETTVDTLKAGDGEKQVNRVAFCFTATADIIKQAAAWGADVLITHEPTYFDHFDNFVSTPVTEAKKELLLSTGMTVYRWHDHAHAAVPDVIHKGFIDRVGLKGVLSGRFFTLDTPLTAVELAKQIEQTAGIKHARIAGETSKPISVIGVCLGACGGMVYDAIKADNCQCVIAGEICEWRDGCYVRDAAHLGFNKSIIALGHCGSERDGMKYLTDVWNEKHPEVQGKYFEVEELYSYTD